MDKSKIGALIKLILIILMIIGFVAGMLVQLPLISVICFIIAAIIIWTWSSKIDKARNEWLDQQLNSFLDSHEIVRNADKSMIETEHRSYAPFIKDEAFQCSNICNYVYKETAMTACDFAFGKEYREDNPLHRDDPSEYTIRFEPVSGGRSVKSRVKRIYPLIKVRAEALPCGGSDEAEKLSFGDEDMDRRFTVTSDDPEEAGKTEFLSKLAEVLSGYPSCELSFSVWNKELHSYYFFKEKPMFSTNDTGAGERYIQALKEQLEITKKISDLL
ncbi:MAG: hypothetical protein J5685_02375 [Clostridiales bacterium]|nr:hypothetical protein [Clostridiales bacterium]